MCLFTDQLKAKVATTDILVYKVVRKVFGNTYETPFMGYRFFFKDGETAEIRGALPKTCQGVVAEGVHAYTHKGVAEYKAKCCGDDDDVLWAIVPEGCLYYDGVFSDIVSEKLIIFKTYGAYKAYEEQKRAKK